MSATIRYNVARGMLSAIRRGAYNGTLAPLGISEEDFELVTRNEIWSRNDRQTVVNTIEAVCHGGMDLLSLPRLELPAEYLAAAICTIVRPTNFQVACRWLERGVTVSAEGIEDGSLEPVKANVLFVLVCELFNDEETGKARGALEKKINARLRAHDDGENEHGKAAKV